MARKVRMLEALGYYIPNAFFLNVNTDGDLSQWQSWKPEVQCTYLHEYIHFLQDLSTLNGIYNIYCIGEYLQDAVVNNIYPSIEGMIKVPINTIPGDSNKVYDNIFINEQIMGDDKDVTSDEIETLMVSGRALKTHRPYKANSEQIDLMHIEVPFNNGKDSFVLGAIQISESMAYIGEGIAFGDKVREPSPNYPYCVVEQLARFYNEDLSQNDSLLFALCDLALCYSHPGKALVTYFEEIEKSGCPTKEDVRDFIQYLIDHESVQMVGIKADSRAQLLVKYAENTIQSLDNRFAGYEHRDLRGWYKKAIQSLISLRIKNPTFMLDLVEWGGLNGNYCYEQLLKTVGTPLLSNNVGELYQEKDSSNFIGVKRMAIFRAAMSICGALERGDLSCELLDYCNNLGYKTSDNCKNAPWKNARCFNPCPYGRLWYAWNLRKYTLC